MGKLYHFTFKTIVTVRNCFNRINLELDFRVFENVVSSNNLDDSAYNLQLTPDKVNVAVLTKMAATSLHSVAGTITLAYERRTEYM